MVYRKILEKRYEVRTCTNGMDVLSEFAMTPADIVILDNNMPEMNGLVFLRELNRSFPSVNVIMVTAYGGVESYLEAMNLGAFEYLNKPVKFEELKAVMEKIFNRDLRN